MYIQKNNKKIYFENCTTFFDRLIGFMIKIEPISTGKRFPKCNSIHTFFMFQPIDIIMTDKNHKIIKMYESLSTEKIILPKKNVYYTYELPLNTCKLFTINEILNIKEDKS
ncbi:MAG: hypothetical protein HFG48_01385 [Bacilli bacterium]|nr:hypothetical protein [Bacilli bacterium]